MLSISSAWSLIFCLKVNKGETQGPRRRSPQILSKPFKHYILNSCNYGVGDGQGFGPSLNILRQTGLGSNVLALRNSLEVILLFLYLCFLICTMGTIKVPVSEDCILD